LETDETGGCRGFQIHIVPAVLECANCSLHATVGGALSETIATNTAKHLDGGVGSVVANHRSVGESSVVVTTLIHQMASPEQDGAHIWIS